MSLNNNDDELKRGPEDTSLLADWTWHKHTRIKRYEGEKCTTAARQWLQRLGLSHLAETATYNYCILLIEEHPEEWNGFLALRRLRGEWV